ncbi:sensor histidine kinase [Entomobacter blattae]|uniref:histidine kinase n=1 Tax=Entomobacter blattae TaxID=2762277 RepID=A0A7H1NUS4_9PROT|nr:HAMP domain-containing sensor histidine kinase [Entomobacter blattae]QNT79534.1 Adaptive-response sensory-kinase SasA [Entomobacter blattae]
MKKLLQLSFKRKKHTLFFFRITKFFQHFPLTASMQFALLYGFIFSVSSAAFVVFLWWQTTREIENQIHEQIQKDMQDLVVQYKTSNITPFLQTLHDRIQNNVNRQAIYLLTDADYHKISGNLTHWPRQKYISTQWSTIDLPTPPFLAHQATAITLTLPNDYHLLVGRSILMLDLFQRVLRNALAWIWLLIILSTFGGIVLTRLLLHSLISTISYHTRELAQGDMSARIPLGDWGGELDEVCLAINSMLNRISLLMKGIKQVSNSIAHDLKTPIARARTRLEDALLNTKTTEEYEQTIENAVEDLDNITRIFESILRISEIESGSRRAAFKIFDVNLVIHNLVKFYDAVAEEKGITLYFNHPPILNIYGDTHLIQQAVANLLDNAIKFSAPNSVIKIWAKIDEKQPVPHIYLAIEDQGPGMKESEIHQATERFFRAESSRNTPGFGLGLSMVEAIAHLHQGTFKLENNNATPGLKAILILPRYTHVNLEEKNKNP